MSFKICHIQREIFKNQNKKDYQADFQTRVDSKVQLYFVSLDMISSSQIKSTSFTMFAFARNRSQHHTCCNNIVQQENPFSRLSQRKKAVFVRDTCSNHSSSSLAKRVRQKIETKGERERDNETSLSSFRSKY